jgi:hypothetical protein
MTRKPWPLFVIALSLLLLSGCSDDGDGGGSTLTDTQGTSGADGATSGADGQGDTTPPPCTVGSCPSGEVCDLSSGQCVAGEACSTQAPTCADAGAACDTCRGLCALTDGKRACTEQSNCFSDQYCDPCTHLCEEKAPLCGACVFDRECGGDNDRCVDIISAGGRFCAQACASVLECPEGYDCPASLGQCVPASGQCANPAACQADTDCRAADTICQRGRCVPGCTDSGACPSGRVCERGRCEDACPTRACDSGLVCDTARGVCAVDGECLSSQDCPEAETYCDPTTRQCVAGCQQDDDCLDASKVCEAGACAPRGCTYAGSCSFSQVCDAAGACQAAVGPYCDTCDPNAAGACGPEANKCIELKDDQDQSLGNFCFVACQADPNNRCPQGYQCVPLEDQEGNASGEVCFRDCTFDPWAP